MPAAFVADVEPVLRAHGVKFTRLNAVHSQQHVQAFRADAVTLDATSTEGHQRVTLKGKWQDESHDIGTGALIVPIAQPRARLVHALFEPQGPDSFAAWGVFNNRFEQKEYMES